MQIKISEPYPSLFFLNFLQASIDRLDEVM